MSARDWTEDFPHENGNYLCICAICGQRFLGHKRRAACKDCATIGSAPQMLADLAEMRREAARLREERDKARLDRKELAEHLVRCSASYAMQAAAHNEVRGRWKAERDRLREALEAEQSARDAEQQRGAAYMEWMAYTSGGGTAETRWALSVAHRKLKSEADAAVGKADKLRAEALKP